MKCSRLPRIAQGSAEQFSEQSGLRDVTCQMIGVPRPIAVHIDGRIEVGSILKLAMGIAPVEHALCASPRSVVAVSQGVLPGQRVEYNAV